MFDIIHKFNVVLCFKQRSNNINELMSTRQQSVDSGVQPQHGAPLQPHDNGVQTHDVATHEAHDDNMVVY